MTEAAIPKRVLLDDKTYNVVTVRNGGMGRVWVLEQAFRESLDPIYRHRLAVKTFDFSSDEGLIERELNIWISLKHSSVLDLLKIGRLNYRLAAIMPQMSGSLDDVLESEQRLTEPRTLSILHEIAGALDHAWSTFGVLHLDIKPSNILVPNLHGESVKVADWGISRLPSTTTARSTMAKHLLPQRHLTEYSAGTPLYMSPERFSGSWTMTPAADIYSIGLMAIQMATGLLPFRFGQVDPLEEITSGAYFMNARSVLSHLSAPFQRVCLASIHPDPSRRLADYRSLIHEIRSLLRD